MEIINYLLNLVIDEEDIIKELLIIDNSVSHMNITYNDFINIIKATKYSENNLDTEYNIITDGNISSVLYALINYRSAIKKINIDNFCFGINKWLVTRINQYLNCNIVLDKEAIYTDYFDKIIIIGDENFTLGVGNVFPNALKIII